MENAPTIKLTKVPASRTKNAFLERAINAVQRIADEMTDDALAGALAAGSDIGTLAHAISSPDLKDPALEIDPLAPARARALKHRKEIAEEAGPMLTVSDATSLLRITRQALDKRRKAGSVLGTRVGSEWRYPELQFQNGALLPRLKDILKAHHGVDGWVILDSIIGASAAYGNRSIVDLLRQGDNKMLDRTIRELEEQYAP